MATIPKRVAKHWARGSWSGESFDLTTIDEKNFINQLLVLKQEDVTFSFIMEVFGTFNNKRFANPYDTFEVPAHAYEYMDRNGKLVSNTNSFTTTLGLWVFNVVFFKGFNFCDYVGGYVNTTIGKNFEKYHQKLIYALMEDKIKLDDYKRFLDYTQFFMPFETILSPNHTEELLLCTKEINKKKAELYKKYKKEIDSGNEVVAEKMEKELLDFALDLLGEDPGLDPFLSGAGGNIGNNFKNTFVMRGAIRNVDPNAKQQFNIALSNWADGISADEYSLIANSLAGGPYSRAKKTEVGGYWEKLLVSMYESVRLDPPNSDCGTKDYLKITITDKNYSNLMYSYIVTSSGKLEELTMDTLDKYMNKEVKLRWSGYCKSKTGFCHHCAGNFFYRRSNGQNPNIGIVMAQIGSNLKARSMKAFHDSTVNTHQIDVNHMFGQK